ncbi:hypothetical protein STANM309S_04681 [Streptomyces tanashiensis]
MTEQILTEPVETETSVPAEAAEAAQPAEPRKSRKPLLWGIVRWTAAVLVCGGVGAGTAMGITAMERTDVPGLATESDGRWEYPRLALPALPEGVLRPYSDGNDGEVHHADLRKLLLPAPAGATVDPKLKGGWAGTDSYLALLEESDRGTVKEYLADSALRHVAARGWTTPDGTTTRIHLLRFSSVAFAEDFKDEVTREVSKSSRLPLGVEAVKIDMSVQGRSPCRTSRSTRTRRRSRTAPSRPAGPTSRRGTPSVWSPRPAEGRDAHGAVPADGRAAVAAARLIIRETHLTEWAGPTPTKLGSGPSAFTAQSRSTP